MQTPAKPPHFLRHRRRLIKRIGAAGAAFAMAKTVPKRWTRPLVSAVLLPAHAQTSLTNFQIVSCTAESGNGAPAGQLFQTGGESVVNLSAQVSPPPPPGTLIRLSVVTAPVDQNYSSQTSPTDAAGLANSFPFTYGLPNAEPLAIGTVFTLTYSFDDPGQFGDSQCVVLLTVIPTPIGP